MKRFAFIALALMLFVACAEKPDIEPKDNNPLAETKWDAPEGWRTIWLEFKKGDEVVIGLSDRTDNYTGKYTVKGGVVVFYSLAWEQIWREAGTGIMHISTYHFKTATFSGDTMFVDVEYTSTANPNGQDVPSWKQEFTRVR